MARPSFRLHLPVLCILALALDGSLLARTAQAEPIHLLCGDLLDAEAARLRGASTLVVEGDRIVEVLEGHRSAERVVDLTDHTCLPGLIDLHTHLTSEMSPKSYGERFRLDPADYAIRSVVYAERTLRAGFTTVRNVGDSGNVSIALRNAIERGWVPGPRIYTSGKSLATTGGHADPTNGVRMDLRGDPGAKEGVVNGIEDGRKAVRQRYKDGADLIKITATGGVLSVAKSGQNPQFTEEEIRAIVETANDYGFHVAAHAHGAEGMKRAVRAGVRTIEHGTLMDDETMKLMKKNGTWYVPTIIAGKWVAEKAEIDGYFPEAVRPKAAAIGPKIQDTFARAYRAGVPIAFGTDSGVSAHGDNAKEFVYMVEAGMPPLEALRTATWNAASVLDARDEIGSLEAGKRADVIAVPGDPEEEIGSLLDVGFVMKAGEIYLQP